MQRQWHIRLWLSKSSIMCYLILLNLHHHLYSMHFETNSFNSNVVIIIIVGNSLTSTIKPFYHMNYYWNQCSKAVHQTKNINWYSRLFHNTSKLSKIALTYNRVRQLSVHSTLYEFGLFTSSFSHNFIRLPTTGSIIYYGRYW